MKPTLIHFKSINHRISLVASLFGTSIVLSGLVALSFGTLKRRYLNSITNESIPEIIYLNQYSNYFHTLHSQILNQLEPPLLVDQNPSTNPATTYQTLSHTLNQISQIKTTYPNDKLDELYEQDFTNQLQAIHSSLGSIVSTLNSNATLKTPSSISNLASQLNQLNSQMEPLLQTRIDSEITEINRKIQLHDRFNHLLSLTMGLFTIVVLLILLFGRFFMVKTVIHPLITLEAYAHQIAQGNTHIRFSSAVKRSDEIGSLASSLDHMRSTIDQLVTNLETQVKKQTLKLNRKVIQLKKIVELTSDTEIYAEQLRQENLSLKKQLKSHP